MTELLSTMAQVTLGPGYLITLDAIDPSSGDEVTGVIVSNIAIGCSDLSGPVGDNPVGPTGPYLYQVGSSA